MPRIAAIERQRAADEHVGRLKIFGGTALLIVGLIAAGVVTFMVPDGNPVVTSGSGVTITVAVVAASWRFLWPLLRPDRPAD